MIPIESTIAAIFKKERLGEVVSVKRLPGGFNCSVYKIIDTKKNAFIAKKYVSHNDDPRSRLSVEFQSLTFLWNHGVRAIAEPISISNTHSIGLYRFIPGVRIRRGAYTHHDIGAVTNFWKRIHALRTIPEAGRLPIAKEACFTYKSYIDIVKARFDAFKTLPRDGVYNKLHHFLDSDFAPFYRQVRQYIEHECDVKGLDLEAELPDSYRTLSPSDFGFHNAIRTPRGEILFHDFEYFGWDDPAKMIADFYLHPRMALPYKLREFFYKNVYNELDRDITLPRRLSFVYMLLALKWCLIMLNVYRRPETRRGKNLVLCRRQLAKAKAQLNETIAELEMRSFPLSLSETP